MSSGMSSKGVLCIFAIFILRASAQVQPVNQYVGIDQDFQFYVPTVRAEASGRNRHRFEDPQGRTPHIPTSPLVGATLVSVERQNIEDYYEDDAREAPQAPRTLEEQIRLEEEYRRAQETYKRDEDYRRESLRRLEQEETERSRQRPQIRLQNPTPTARPLESLTNFVGIHQEPQPQRQRHQPQPQVNNFQDQHVIKPRIRTQHPRIDPFAALRDFPTSSASTQRIAAPPPQQIQVSQPREEELAPQSLFARVDTLQERRRPQQPQPRPTTPRPQPRFQPQATRGNFEDPAQTQRRRDYEEQLFRQQAEGAQYQFASDVQDDINGNHQGRQEIRDGANVKGMYSYSDGYYKRTVFYEADDKGYRVVKEDVEPLGDGPQVNPRGGASVSSYVAGNEVNYSITMDDIQKKQLTHGGGGGTRGVQEEFAEHPESRFRGRFL